ncbi:MAG: RNA polymerase sigma factor [Fimbriimonadaceae bacterium]
MTRRPGSRSDEASLIACARSGDRASFDVLADRYRLKLRSFLVRRLPAGEVDDVLQESLIAAWKAVPSYEGRSEFKTWLIAITQYKLQDHFRRQRVPPIAIDSFGQEPSAVEPAFDRFDLVETVRPILEALAPPKAAILELYYGQRMTFEEIAQHLGRNTSTVKYHFYQAHETVAAALTAGDKA